MCGCRPKEEGLQHLAIQPRDGDTAFAVTATAVGCFRKQVHVIMYARSKRGALQSVSGLPIIWEVDICFFHINLVVGASSGLSIQLPPAYPIIFHGLNEQIHCQIGTTPCKGYIYPCDGCFTRPSVMDPFRGPASPRHRHPRRTIRASSLTRSN